MRIEQHSAYCLVSYFSDWLMALPLQFCRMDYAMHDVIMEFAAQLLQLC